MQIKSNSRRHMLKDLGPGEIVSGLDGPDPYIMTDIDSGEDTMNCKFKVLVNLRTGKSADFEQRAIVNSHPYASCTLED